VRLVAALQAWLEQRAGAQSLFLNFDRAQKGRRLTSTSIYRIVRELGEHVSVKARPHGSGTRRSRRTSTSRMGMCEPRLASAGTPTFRTLTVYDDNRQDLSGKMARLVAASL
jgi:integrase/recombinase XerC